MQYLLLPFRILQRILSGAVTLVIVTLSLVHAIIHDTIQTAWLILYLAKNAFFLYIGAVALVAVLYLVFFVWALGFESGDGDTIILAAGALGVVAGLFMGFKEWRQKGGTLRLYEFVKVHIFGKFFDI